MIQKLVPSDAGVRRASSAAGEFTNTVPVRISRRIENTRMTHFAAVPR